jgi:hypothetical protein
MFFVPFVFALIVGVLASLFTFGIAFCFAYLFNSPAGRALAEERQEVRDAKEALGVPAGLEAWSNLHRVAQGEDRHADQGLDHPFHEQVLARHHRRGNGVAEGRQSR